MPQSADLFAIWQRVHKSRFLFKHLVTISVVPDTFCGHFCAFSPTSVASQLTHSDPRFWQSCTRFQSDLNKPAHSTPLSFHRWWWQAKMPWWVFCKRALQAQSNTRHSLYQSRAWGRLLLHINRLVWGMRCTLAYITSCFIACSVTHLCPQWRICWPWVHEALGTIREWEDCKGAKNSRPWYVSRQIWGKRERSRPFLALDLQAVIIWSTNLACNYVQVQSYLVKLIKP